jgi:hypothetical protein
MIYKGTRSLPYLKNRKYDRLKYIFQQADSSASYPSLFVGMDLCFFILYFVGCVFILMRLNLVFICRIRSFSQVCLILIYHGVVMDFTFFNEFNSLYIISLKKLRYDQNRYL